MTPCAEHEATLALALERVKRLEEALREHRCGDCGGLVYAVFDPDEDYDCRTCRGLRVALNTPNAPRPEGT